MSARLTQPVSGKEIAASVDSPCGSNRSPWVRSTLYGSLAMGAFHLAMSFPWAAGFIVVFALLLIDFARDSSPRFAFYGGLIVGFGIYAPQLSFFWTIFQAAAIALWLVLAFWIGLFSLLVNRARKWLTPTLLTILIPIIWTGLEYFRSEVYYLRFAWLTLGDPTTQAFPTLTRFLGIYGLGFLLMATAALLSRFRIGWQLGAIAGVLILFAAVPKFVAANAPVPGPVRSIQVCGVQLEFPTDLEVVVALDQSLTNRPGTELFVLSEYTFDGPIPARVLKWCRQHRKYLIAGGKDATGDNFYNTAFVVDPSGEVVFKQVKSVPIQFFKDGLPAPSQKVWESPWGKIGICVCYDLSYRQIVDELIRQGAQALIVPTMDVQEWGNRQHQLHARIAPRRAIEYGVPIFRVCSSGVSQWVDALGLVRALAPYPGQGETLVGRLELGAPGKLPLDHFLRF